MKYIVDHDLHIHSQLSLCSKDPEQTAERMLKYAEDNNYKTICVTDHFWDETVEGASNWYSRQDFAHICEILPLPESKNIRFLFGCETEQNKFQTVGVSKERFDSFGFVIIPTTHFHMDDYTVTAEETATPQARANTWCRRFDELLKKDLPFEKIGIAHLTCGLIAREREIYLETLKLIPETEAGELFTRAAKTGVGIELNASDMGFEPEEQETVLRIYRIAKAAGCKFYCGSDAHHPKVFEYAKSIFENAVSLLELTENDKFIVG